MKFIGLIPARYASTRFPGKPLAQLGGMTVIERVYRRAKGVFDEVYVCTDDQRIFDAVLSFGGKAVMTSSDHRSGTDRCYEEKDLLLKKYNEFREMNLSYILLNYLFLWNVFLILRHRSPRW